MPFYIINGNISITKTDMIVITDSYNTIPNSIMFNTSQSETTIIPSTSQFMESYIIHTIYSTSVKNEDNKSDLLYSAYYNSLKYAESNHCTTISIPLIYSETYPLPFMEIIRIIESASLAFLQQNDLLINLIISDKIGFQLSETDALQEYIRHHYTGLDISNQTTRFRSKTQASLNTLKSFLAPLDEELVSEEDFESFENDIPGFFKKDIDTLINNLDESFSEALLQLIDKKNFTDTEVYKRANIDRKLFSKIRCNSNYHPKKQTAVALVIALQLTLSEAEDLLKKAGYTFSNSEISDVIVQYFINKKEYDIYKINEALFYYDQHLLG